ncbi:hypothetical protein ABK040_006912 [Willaertia magna]
MEKLLQDLDSFLQEKDGDGCVELLHDGYFYELFIDEEHATENPPEISSIKPLVNKYITVLSFRSFLTNYFQGLISFYYNENYKTAFEQMFQAISDFIIIFEKEDHWTIPMMKYLSSILRTFANKALSSLGSGEEEVKEESEEGPLEKSARLLQRGFGICAADRSPLDFSKKWSALHIVNNLLRIYFQLNKLSLCTKLIKTVEESKSLPNLEEFPVSQRVTYKFFSGRVAILESNLSKAKLDLEYALHYCLDNYPKNKRMILQYLSCVNLMLGKYPTVNLCKRYNMLEFLELSKACRSGDLKTYCNELEKYKLFFIQHGTYLMLEKIKLIVYRNLLRRVYYYNCENHPETSSRLDLNLFLVALRFQPSSVKIQQQMDLDEAECLITNLIYLGYIRGYVSHDKQMLVLSKKEPFPALSTIQI